MSHRCETGQLEALKSPAGRIAENRHEDVAHPSLDYLKVDGEPCRRAKKDKMPSSLHVKAAAVGSCSSGPLPHLGTYQRFENCKLFFCTNPLPFAFNGQSSWMGLGFNMQKASF